MENQLLKTKIALLIPTYNAGDVWKQVLQSIAIQTQKIHRFIILDSESSDNTISLAQLYGAEVLTIAKKDFSHGYARHKLIAHCPEVDCYVFLTQDAILESTDSIKRIVAALNDASIGAAYGKQLPRADANALEKHDRNFNYPSKSFIKAKADIDQLGFKTIFCSNSFASYKKKAYFQSGGFPLDANFGEDTLLVANMILKGWKIAYIAEAAVLHSHNLTIKEEFVRYREIGKFHQQNPWLYDKFGKPGKEGIKYLLSEIKYCLTKNPFLLFNLAVKMLNRYVGYKTGLNTKIAKINNQPSEAYLKTA